MQPPEDVGGDVDTGELVSRGGYCESGEHGRHRNSCKVVDIDEHRLHGNCRGRFVERRIRLCVWKIVDSRSGIIVAHRRVDIR